LFEVRVKLWAHPEIRAREEDSFYEHDMARRMTKAAGEYRLSSSSSGRGEP
jgi:hypothetical protein